MALTPGTRLGVYEVIASIGVGGMGEVFRARDTKLNRDVALKVLPDSFASDPDRLARFTREAQTLASLNHPNIAHIHGLEESSDVRALVMELVEGEDLSQRIARGAIPLDEALAIAKQIAEALEAAHDEQIIHRDLKPANVKVREDGTVKVLDFGLAKAMDPAGAASPNVSRSPTITTPAMTQAGLILGTAAYMSPEQASGRTVDKRADIWSFGVVLWEMLTGRRLFDGETVSHTLADVLRAEIDFAKLPTNTPTAVRGLLGRCLERDAKTRLRDIGEARVVIANSGRESEAPAVPVRRSWALPWALAATAALAIVAAAVTTLAFVASRHVQTTNDIRFLVTTPDLPALPDNALAVSPDGRSIAFVASTPTKDTALYVRQMGSTSSQLLPGTEGAGNLFWSPDSRFVAFSAGNVLKKVDTTGGPPQAICEMPGGNRAGTWNRDGTIVFASNATLNRVSAEGGRPVPLVSLNAARQETFLTSPDFLPDGRHFLYVGWGGLEADRAIYVGSLDSPATTRLITSSSKALYAHPGYLLYEREGVLFAQSFDPKRLLITGEPTRIADHVGHISSGPHSAFSVSQNGVLIYREDSSSAQQFVWVDRSGKKRDPIAEPGSYGPFDLSPDGTQIAVTRRIANSTDIWLIDVVRGVSRRLTHDPANKVGPVWSPDGRHVAFSSDRNGLFQKFEKEASGLGEDGQLVAAVSSRIMRLNDWSKDGAYLAYTSAASSSSELDVLPLLRDRTPVSMDRSRANNRHGRFSPDTRWLAYQSDESGQWQVDVMSFPAADQKRQISTKGGTQPRWRGDGKELYYLAPDGHMMVVEMQLGATIEPGVPRTLFETGLPSDVLGLGTTFAVTADGQRFLLAAPVAQSSPDPITVVLNWWTALKK